MLTWLALDLAERVGAHRTCHLGVLAGGAGRVRGAVLKHVRERGDLVFVAARGARPAHDVVLRCRAEPVDPQPLGAPEEVKQMTSVSLHQGRAALGGV